ncbi:MAG: transketolase [Desulfuromonadaceae bacterium]|nr:transketolase [Desulfuromonadaceae bacterium]
MRQSLSSEDIRKKTIQLSCRTGAGHLAPSLSTVEILTVLFRDFLHYNPSNPHDDARDRFILSKGHGAYAYYVILNHLGFLPENELKYFYTDQSSITGCLSRNQDYMIEASTGSLGHGLPIAVGMALAFKMQKKQNRVVCLVGDGEMQEGSNFEALQFAYRFKLDNLLLIVDANSLQAMDRVENVALDTDRLAKVLSTYCESTFLDIDGHDEDCLKQSFSSFFRENDRETFTTVFCRTVKGKGIDFMEHVPKYHFRCPIEDGYTLETEVPV